MVTNEELLKQVENLSTHVTRVQASNSELRDELAVLRSNYNNFTEQVSERLEVIFNTFQAQKKTFQKSAQK